MDYCLADETSKGVYDYVKLKFQDTLSRNMFKRSNANYCIADETSKGVYDHVNLKLQDTLARNMFNRLKNVLLSGR